MNKNKKIVLGIFIVLVIAAFITTAIIITNEKNKNTQTEETKESEGISKLISLTMEY